MAESRFCTQCGRPLRQGQAFCTACGTRVGQNADAIGSPSIVSAPVAQPAAVIAQGARAAAALGGVPWQSVVGGKDFDLSAFLASGAMPVAQAAVSASLRAPALALLATSLLDLAAALLSGQPAALRAVGLRVGLAAITALLGIIAGRHAGRLRAVTGVFSVATAMVQLGSLLMTAFAAIADPATLLALAPSILTQLSSLATAVKTAIVGLRR